MLLFRRLVPEERNYEVVNNQILVLSTVCKNPYGLSTRTLSLEPFMFTLPSYNMRPSG